MFLVGVCETRFPHQPAAHAVDHLAGGAARHRCAATRATCRSCAGYDKAGARRATASDTRAHDATEELRLGYVAFTRAAPPARGVVVPLEPDAPTPLGPSPYQRRSSASCSASWGETPTPGWTKPAKGDAQPATTPRPVAALAGDRARPRGAAAARRRRAGARGRPRRRRGRRARPRRGRPGRRVGRRARAAARRGAGRAGAGGRGARCPPACPRPRWPGCATTRRRSPRPGPPDAAAAVAGGPVRHPVPRVGGEPVRPAAD